MRTDQLLAELVGREEAVSSLNRCRCLLVNVACQTGAYVHFFNRILESSIRVLTMTVCQMI